MSAKDTLNALALKLRESADLYRRKGDKQDRAACSVEYLAEMEEDVATTALAILMKQYPQWFPS